MPVVRIVGSVVTWSMVLFFASVVRAQELTLQMTSSTGEPIAQAAMGVPFIIQLIDNSSAVSVDQLVIPGMDAFHSLGTSISMSTINKQNSTTYKYIVRMDKEGTYVVGPACINHKTSNKLHVVVGKDFSYDKKQKKNRGAASFSAQFLLEKNKLFVGEKTKLTLRFYYPEDEGVQLSAITIPTELEKNGCILSNLIETKGQEVVDKNDYNFIQWSWDMYCKQACLITLPACCISYGIRRSNNFFISFIDFFDQKKLYSNALTLEVQPLPGNGENISAVGQFSSFSMSVSPDTAQQGAAIVLTLVLSGDGNFDCIQTPVLQDIPSEFRVYGSQHQKNDGLQSSEKKSFEYVLHGLHAGMFVIPAQKFTYFDPVTQKYNTLFTQDVTITIIPDPSFVLRKDILPSDSIMHEAEAVKDALRLLRYEATALYKNNDQYALPWFLFFFLFFFPIMSIFFYGLLLLGDRYYGVLKKIAGYRAYKDAYKKLKEAEINDQYAAVYDIFIGYCATLLHCPVNMVSTHVMQEYGIRCGFTPEEMDQWILFLDELSQKKFSQGYQEGQDHTFFMHARQWLLLLFKRKKYE